jgi:hypothetical protein
MTNSEIFKLPNINVVLLLPLTERVYKADCNKNITLSVMCTALWESHAPYKKMKKWRSFSLRSYNNQLLPGGSNLDIFRKCISRCGIYALAERFLLSTFKDRFHACELHVPEMGHLNIAHPILLIF